MNTKNALYNNMILLLESIVDNQAEVFEQTLGGQLQADFSSIITSIIDELSIINDSLNDDTIYPNASLLIELVDKLKRDFPAYLIPRANQTISYLLLYRKLVSNWMTIPTFRLNQSKFKIISFGIGNLVEKNYHYHDLDNLDNSVFLLTITDTNRLTTYLDSNPISEVLLLYSLSKLDFSIQTDADSIILLKNQRSYNPREVLAYVKFQIIAEGKFTHQPYEIVRVPSGFNRKRIKIGNGYHQFADTLMILSEYNYHKDLIDKYLRLYHVLENNMYRTQIVKIEQESVGGVFSIREFQRLYKNISKTEQEVLNLMLKQAFELDYVISPTQKFKNFVLKELLIIQATLTDTVLNEILRKFGISTDVRTVNLGTLLTFYSSVVYKFRNAMVHNRETEFHLMHETLSPTIKSFIEGFLIPTIEEMIFLLTSERNSIIWYTNPNITVYQE